MTSNDLPAMNNRPDIDHLLQQMYEVRNRLDYDAESARRVVHDMTDWRSLVSKAPYKAMFGALAIGYLLVPQRVEQRAVDAEEIKRIRGQEPVVITRDDDDVQDTMMSTVVAIAGAALARAASTYIANRIVQYTSSRSE